MARNGKYLVEIEHYHIGYVLYRDMKSYATISITLLDTDLYIYPNEATLAVF